MLEWAQHHKIPLFGICRGLQFINQYFDGTLQKIKNHVGTTHKIYRIQENKELPQQTEVNSFHNYAVRQLGVDLHPLYVCSNRNVEAFQHNVLPIIGIMWHPERETTTQSIDTYLFGSLFGERNET